ncbi:MAG: ribonuclease D, partial [Rhodothermales bacterium]|nr:ribonuclease D [Rhodothermales bacterium]
VRPYLFRPMIDTPESLRDVVERVRQRARVAIDTEFVWERTYYPRLGLVQLGVDEDETYLVDAVALKDLSPLGPLLSDEHTVKILHDARQDLTILRRASGASPQRVFDTRVAAGFVGLSATLSLQAVVQETVGVTLPKGEQRSDWVRRPLSDEQIAYAHSDVRYLPRAYETLRRWAEERGRLRWVEEEMRLLDDPALYEEDDPRERYHSVKSRAKRGFGRRDYAVLREVTAWREQVARDHDRPRKHVVPDDVLVDLARRKPTAEADLDRVRGLSGKARDRYGEAMVEAVRRGLDVPKSEQPRPPQSRRPDETLTPRLDLAQALLRGRGLRDGVDPTLVATRADVEALVAAGPDADADHHALLRGWRRAFIGADLLALMQGDNAVGLDPEEGLPRIVGNGRS